MKGLLLLVTLRQLPKDRERHLVLMKATVMNSDMKFEHFIVTTSFHSSLQYLNASKHGVTKLFSKRI